MALLNEKEIIHSLSDLHGWLREGSEIKKRYEFSDFVHAMAFVNGVALLAEGVNHHPDIDIRWNKVLLSLSTHDHGGITEKDIVLAKKIEDYFS